MDALTKANELLDISEALTLTGQGRSDILRKVATGKREDVKGRIQRLESLEYNMSRVEGIEGITTRTETFWDFSGVQLPSEIVMNKAFGNGSFSLNKSQFLDRVKMFNDTFFKLQGVAYNNSQAKNSASNAMTRGVASNYSMLLVYRQQYNNKFEELTGQSPLNFRIQEEEKTGFGKVVDQVVEGVKDLGASALWLPLMPFREAMKKGLRDKGVNPPRKMAELARTFYEVVIRGQAIQTAEPVTMSVIISAILSFLRGAANNVGKGQGRDKDNIGQLVLNAGQSAMDLIAQGNDPAEVLETVGTGRGQIPGTGRIDTENRDVTVSGSISTGTILVIVAAAVALVILSDNG